MSYIKLCGLSRPQDIQAANELKPEFIGFVFAPKSRRYISPQQGQALRSLLSPQIQAVGVFVNEAPETVAGLLNRDIIDLAQLHGQEDQRYLHRLRALTRKPIIQAFQVTSAREVQCAMDSAADYILLDAGAGTGTTFDWSLLQPVRRPYFLAGGLDPHNVAEALSQLHPYGVDVSSGIETDGVKSPAKMAAFVAAVRKEARS